jgi:hypothetical protein
LAGDIARRDLLDLWRAKMLLFFFILFPILLMSMFINPGVVVVFLHFLSTGVNLTPLSVQMIAGPTAERVDQCAPGCGQGEHRKCPPDKTP